MEFNTNYLTNLSFSDALIYLKRGERLYRTGWNGKNLYVYFMDESTYMEFEADIDGFELATNIEPYFLLISPEKANIWVPSVSDILAYDWEILKN